MFKVVLKENLYPKGNVTTNKCATVYAVERDRLTGVTHFLLWDKSCGWVWINSDDCISLESIETYTN